MWTDNEISDDTEMTTADAAPVARITQQMAPREGSALELMVSAAQQAITRVPKEMIGAAKQIGGLLGADGFYRFPAGGATVEGVSIDLAQALAQQWGGIAYQVRILSVDMLASGGRKVHLRATVTDLKSLVAAEVDQVVTTAAPPGKFAAKAEQAERWHAMQTQSAASKIVRNAILRVLPAWYVSAAFNAARSTADHAATGGKTLPEARKAAVDALAPFGVTRAELEAHTGQPVDLWAAPQLHQLKDLHAELKGGRLSVEQFRASLAEASTPAATGKGALGLGKKAPKTSKPENDDEPPPTGTDGGGGGGAPDEGEGADPKGFAAHQARQSGGDARASADAGPRLVRAWSEEDLVEKDAAWRDHLGACANQFSVRESFDKRVGAFAAEGVKAARELATVQELESRGVAAPSEFLHTPREERGRARPRREGRSWAEFQRTG